MSGGLGSRSIRSGSGGGTRVFNNHNDDDSEIFDTRPPPSMNAATNADGILSGFDCGGTGSPTGPQRHSNDHESNITPWDQWNHDHPARQRPFAQNEDMADGEARRRNGGYNEAEALQHAMRQSQEPGNSGHDNDDNDPYVQAALRKSLVPEE